MRINLAKELTNYPKTLRLFKQYMANIWPDIDLKKWASASEYHHTLYLTNFLAKYNIGMFVWGKDLTKYAYIIDESQIPENEKWNYLVFDNFIQDVKLISKQEAWLQLIVECFKHIELYEHYSREDKPF